MKELVTLIKNKEFAKAKRFLKKALQTEPDNVYLLTQMANVLWNLEKDEEALTFAMKAKEIDSDYPLMLFTLGRILWSLEDASSSIEAVMTDTSPRGTLEREKAEEVLRDIQNGPSGILQGNALYTLKELEKGNLKFPWQWARKEKK